ncbi:MAG TPA: rhomboid family intramembrane serine protease [Candidatus Limnocylindria bacterium]|nr:rhomboid family intramembrane serine protease [Candidatus Limnocylindria bacterium]
MIPLRDQNPRAKTPIANRLLIAANVAVWLYTLSLVRQPAAIDAFYDRYSFDWREFADAIAQGRIALETFAPLFTHMSLHGGWLHVIGNMLYLWIFGDNVEDRLGSGPYLVFYVLCGLVAAIGQGLVQPAPMVGASGAIAGVLGAYLLMFPAARISTLLFLGIFITIVHLPALIVIGFFIVLQMIDALAELRLTAHQATANIAYFAHIFGFFAGMLFLLLFRQRREQGRFRFG